MIVSEDTPVFILAGGLGSRLGPLGEIMPKPLLEIGKIPMVVHIIKLYKAYGYKNFYILAGRKKEKFQEYFSKNQYNSSVNVLDTGEDSLTGTRIKVATKFTKTTEYFHVTYGDGIGNINIKKLTHHFLQKNAVAQLAAVKPPPRYGNIKIKGDKVISFKEKHSEIDFVNGGFYIFNQKILEDFPSSNFALEEFLLPKLADEGKLHVYKHKGFWFSMDTQRDLLMLNTLWDEGKMDYLTC